jgi:hypothetical protein
MVQIITVHVLLEKTGQTATRYGLDGRGSNLGGREIFRVAQNGPVTHPDSCIFYTGSFSGMKRPKRRADHPPPSSAGMRMG